MAFVGGMPNAEEHGPVLEGETPTEVTLEGLKVKSGSHLCTVYESERGRLKLALPFLEQGLSRGELCFLVAPEGSREALLERLSERVSVQQARDEGYLVEASGFPTGDEAFRFFEEAFSEAVARGRNAFRLLGDMAWMLDAGLDVEAMNAFEMRYEHFLAKQYPVVSLCQYDASRFSGVEVLRALKCHSDTFGQPVERFLAG
ncbi:MEDS domain-containing protein [Thiohalorhabdus sp. Cl-TMA]|uniref:MEDS domain-containing protein n=1 Tax=Thiohalorhabdus methylotrophus TaxID=3242694 RepID=A0ABV4TYE4_9GAMM